MRTATLTGVAALIMAAVVAGPSAQPADVIRAASQALGADALQSIAFKALGASFSVGQSASPGERWPRLAVRAYTASIDYETPGMRVELEREQGPIPPRGGGRPFTGTQRLIQVVSGSDAWDEPEPAGRGGRGGRGAAPEPPPPQPQPDAVALRTLQIWLTPHGFLKGAQTHETTTRDVEDGTEVSFTLESGHRIAGVIDRRRRVTRVQTWIDDPVLGDMPVEVTYQDYREVADGIVFPMYMVQSQGGHPALELWVHDVQPNATVQIATPPAVAGASAPPVEVVSEAITDGVVYLTGGSHHSVAIEMDDHVVLVEAPLDEARARAVMAAVAEAIPDKPIRYVVNTHHHFDHAGGLRTFVDAGATIVTHALNQPFYEAAWANPRTLNPDALSVSGRAPVFQTFTDRYTFTSGSREIEVYHLDGNPHDAGLAMVYLPGERILIEADAFTPTPAATGEPPVPARGRGRGGPPFVPTTINLFETIGRLGLSVDRIAALHGPRVATMADLAIAAGRE